MVIFNSHVKLPEGIWLWPLRLLDLRRQDYVAGIAAVQATGAFVGLDWWNSGRNGVIIHFFFAKQDKKPWGLVSGLQTSTTKTIPNMGVSENSVPLNPMVLLIIIPMKNGYFIGNIPNIFRQTHMFLVMATGTTLCLTNGHIIYKLVKNSIANDKPGFLGEGLKSRGTMAELHFLHMGQSWIVDFCLKLINLQVLLVN